VQTEGLSERKITVTPSGIEPATFLLVANCLKRLLLRAPRFEEDTSKNKTETLLLKVT